MAVSSLFCFANQLRFATFHSPENQQLLLTAILPETSRS
jgi:hypothetical protein